jgi:hypothetical protein
MTKPSHARYCENGRKIAMDMFNDVFVSYLYRAQALRDGTHVDVTAKACAFGISYAVSFHKHVWLSYLARPEFGMAEKSCGLDAVLQGAAARLSTVEVDTGLIKFFTFSICLPAGVEPSPHRTLGFMVEHNADASGYLLIIRARDWELPWLAVGRPWYKDDVRRTVW